MLPAPDGHPVGPTGVVLQRLGLAGERGVPGGTRPAGAAHARDAGSIAPRGAHLTGREAIMIPRALDLLVVVDGRLGKEVLGFAGRRFRLRGIGPAFQGTVPLLLPGRWLPGLRPVRRRAHFLNPL